MATIRLIRIANTFPCLRQHQIMKRFFADDTEQKRPPFPPFTKETAIQKVQTAEDAWNTKNYEKVSMAYTIDSKWRNRDTFIEGREQIQAFLKSKWEKELNYKLKKHYFCHNDNQIAVTFQYEYQNRDNGKWYRAYGNEHWTFDENGLMKIRNASINDVEIHQSELKIGIDGTNIEYFKTGVET
eukprot:273282_1